jgi:RecA/RadA recombinase
MVLNGIVSGSLFGGVPKNRMTLFAGPSMTGKSFIIQKILANAQKEGLIPVIFDSENAIDKEGAENLGLDTSKVKYVPTFSIEECRNTIYDFLTKVKDKGQEGKFIIAIDSLGNMESQLQINRQEKGNVSADMGSRAKAMKSLLRTCTQLAALTKTTILATNHIFEDPSALFPSLVKDMPGGKATVYLPSVTVQLARKPVKEDKNTDGKLAVAQKNYSGVILRALTVKNRFVKQYLEGEMYLSFDKGLNKYYGLLDLAVGLGAVVQTGSTYQLPDETKLGYYSKWKDNTELWDNTIIPVIEEKIEQEWKYGNKNKNEEIPEEEIKTEEEQKLGF